MSKVQEIVFDCGDTSDYSSARRLDLSAAPVSLDGWFEGFGDMLTVDDLAAILHVSRKTVQHQCKRGDLPAVSIGRRWYVPKARLVEMLITGRKNHIAE